MNLNELAKQVTLSEGLKKQISIGQVKEVLRIVFTILSTMTVEQVATILRKYRK